jgi:hypothetical protein
MEMMACTFDRDMWLATALIQLYRAVLHATWVRCDWNRPSPSVQMDGL